MTHPKPSPQKEKYKRIEKIFDEDIEFFEGFEKFQKYLIKLKKTILKEVTPNE